MMGYIVKEFAEHIFEYGITTKGVDVEKIRTVSKLVCKEMRDIPDVTAEDLINVFDAVMEQVTTH